MCQCNACNSCCNGYNRNARCGCNNGFGRNSATEAAVIPVRPVFAIRLPAQWKICSQTTAAVAAVTDASIVTTVAAVIPAITAAVATMIAAKPIVITHASMRFSEKADAVTAVVTVRSELP